jgi:hypothetical protein
VDFDRADDRRCELEAAHRVLSGAFVLGKVRYAECLGGLPQLVEPVIEVMFSLFARLGSDRKRRMES